MVQPFRHIAQLHEFAEVFHRGIAATAFGVMHEGRAVNRRQHQILATHNHIARRIAGVLRVFARRCRTKLACQTTRDSHPLALDLGTGLAPQFECGRVVDEIHPDLGQNRLGIGLDDLQRFLGQNLEIGDVAFDIAGSLEGHGPAFGTPGCSATATCRSACLNLYHALFLHAEYATLLAALPSDTCFIHALG